MDAVSLSSAVWWPLILILHNLISHFRLLHSLIASYFHSSTQNLFLRWMLKSDFHVYDHYMFASISPVAENMSCLLPQFKCIPDSFTIQFKTHNHHSPNLRKLTHVLRYLYFNFRSVFVFSLLSLCLKFVFLSFSIQHCNIFHVSIHGREIYNCNFIFSFWIEFSRLSSVCFWDRIPKVKL